MRKIILGLAAASSLVPAMAQAETRPVAVSYAAPTNLGVGARVGARTGVQSKEDGALSYVLVAAVAFGAGYLVREWTHHHHHYASPY